MAEVTEGIGSQAIPEEEWKEKEGYPSARDAAEANRVKSQAVPMSEQQRQEVKEQTGRRPLNPDYRSNPNSLKRRFANLAAGVIALVHPVGHIAPPTVDTASKIGEAGKTAVTDTAGRVGELAGSAKEKLAAQFPVPDAEAIRLTNERNEQLRIQKAQKQIGDIQTSMGGELDPTRISDKSRR